MKNFYLKLSVLVLFVLTLSTHSEAQHYVQIGTQNGSSENQTAQFHPNTFSNAKTQSLITNEELRAGGLHPGVEIIGLEWNVTIDNTPVPLYFDLYYNDDYTQPYMDVNQTFVALPMTQIGVNLVDSGSYTGWHTANFTNSFNWDGSDNLVFQLCRTGGSYYPSNSNQGDDRIATYNNGSNLVSQTPIFITGYNHTCSAATGYYSSGIRPLLRVVANCTPTSSTISSILCNGNNYTSPSGKIFNTPGVYADTIANSTFCDSVITITLTSCFSAMTTDTMNVTCNGGNNGSVQVMITGGTAPYSDGTNSYTTNPFTISGLSAGAYAYTITDANGATSAVAATITEPTPLAVNLTNSTDVSCPNSTDGAIDITVSGGISSGNGSNSGNVIFISEANPNTPDFVEIAVNGTVDVTGYQVVISESYTDITLANTTTWQLSGNLTNTVLFREDITGANYWGNNMFWAGGNPSWAIIIDAQGNIVDAVFWGWQAADIATFSTNVGGLTVTNNGAWTGDGVTSTCTNSFVRTNTTDTNTAADFACATPTPGTSSLFLTGGDTYAWSSGATTEDLTNIAAGSYTVTVTNGLGCTATGTYTVGTTPDVTLPTVATQNITVQLDANGNATITEAQIDNGSTDDCTAAGNLTYALDVTTFSCNDIGTNTVTLSVTDGSNNTATATATVTIQDIDVPTVITQNATVQIDAATGAATITTMDIDNGSTDNCTSAGNLTMSLSDTSFSCADIGTNNVMLYVTDASGNIDSAMATVNVLNAIQNFQLVDSTLCSGNTAFDLQSLEPTTYTGGTWTNTVNTTLTNTVVYPVNNTPFTYNYTDANGCSASASLLIDIAQITPITGQNGTIYLDANGQAILDANILNTTTIDNCNADFVYTASNSIFNCNNLGANTINLIATDGQGNTTSTTVTLTIEDTIAPSVTAQNITIDLDNDGNGSITTDDVVLSTADNCGVSSISLSQTDFVIADYGENTVTVTVTDEAGNTTTVDIIVTVNFAVNTNGLEKEEISISAYPNPTRDMINLKLININEPTVQADLIDITGKVLNTYELNTQNAQIDLSIYAAGNYFIRVSSANQVKTLKIVKLD